MKIVIKNGCYYNNGKPAKNIDRYACGGNWQKNKTVNVGDLDHLAKVMEYYNIKGVDVRVFRKLLVTHELGHEIYKNILTFEEKENYKKQLQSFSTVYIDSISNTDYAENMLNEEKFCEYLAYKITGQLIK